MPFFRGKPARCLSSVIPKPCEQIDSWTTFKLSHAAPQLTNWCIELLNAAPWAHDGLEEQRCAAGKNCLSLPPPTCDLLEVFCHLFRYQPGGVSSACKQHSLIPIIQASHEHNRPNSEALIYEAYPSWPELARTVKRAVLYRNTSRNYILSICSNTVKLLSLFVGFGCIWELHLFIYFF